MSEAEEALKALSLARKHDLAGNTEAALKWARKSAAIHASSEANALIKRLEARGASGKGAATGDASASAAPAAAPSGGGAKPAANGSAEPKKERAYTKEQVEVVSRIRSAGGDFYKVLGVEKTVDDNGIKKAYRKLALQLHPDKNGAPGADEAFKLVSKAFTILSDSDKRSAYDRFGGDPEQRMGGASSSASSRFAQAGGPGMRFRGGGFGEEIDPQDLFNMFFGGGMGSGFGPGGATFTFGGPMGSSRTFYTDGGRRARQGQRAQQATPQNASVLLQLLPLLILGLFSLLSYAPSLFTTPDPSYTFAPSGMHRDQRFTPKSGVSYYINRDAFAKHPFLAQASTSNGGLRGFEERVEREWRNRLYGQCERYREHQSRRLQNTQGFFGIGADPEAAAKIRAEKYEPCERLHDFGIYM